MCLGLCFADELFRSIGKTLIQLHDMLQKECRTISEVKIVKSSRHSLLEMNVLTVGPIV